MTSIGRCECLCKTTWVLILQLLEPQDVLSLPPSLPHVLRWTPIYFFKPIYEWNKENSCIYNLSDNDNVIYLNEL